MGSKCKDWKEALCSACTVGSTRHPSPPGAPTGPIHLPPAPPCPTSKQETTAWPTLPTKPHLEHGLLLLKLLLPSWLRAHDLRPRCSSCGSSRIGRRRSVHRPLQLPGHVQHLHCCRCMHGGSYSELPCRARHLHSCRPMHGAACSRVPGSVQHLHSCRPGHMNTCSGLLLEPGWYHN